MRTPLKTKLIRGFSFYHPKNSNPRDHLAKAVDQLGQIAEACHRSDLTFGLEVEANLIGSEGHMLAEIYRQVNHPAMVLIFDGANIVVQGYTQEEVYDQYLAMKRGLGWLHIKDYLRPKGQKKGAHVDEDTMAGFVPSDRGYTGHEAILRDFATLIPKLEKSLKRRGIPGVFVDLEPHVKGGGAIRRLQRPRWHGSRPSAPSPRCSTTSVSTTTFVTSKIFAPHEDSS